MPPGRSEPNLSALLREKARRLDLLLREKARRSLFDFMVQAWPTIEGDTPLVLNWHLRIMCDELQALATGETPHQNLILNVPPGSMKSTIVSVCLPAWMWLRRPTWTALFIAGAEDVSIRDSMKCRNLITSEWYQGFKPGWRLAKDQDAKGWFKNTKGGERQATTIGSRGTGKRVHFIGVDDPNDTKEVSGPKLAATWDAWSLTFQNRLKDMSTGRRVLIQQRTHMADLTGKILEVDAQAWRHVTIRQRFEVGDPQAHPDDPRTQDGELFFPARFPAKVVDSEERVLGSVGFAGQHQQRPVPKEGATFRPSMIEVVEVAPAGLRMCRGWDQAASRGKGDYTVGALLGVDKAGVWYILDIVREQTDEPRRMLRQTAGVDGVEPAISWPQDPGAAGKDQAKSLLQDMAGWNFTYSPETGSKETRWEPFAAQVNGGNMRMVRAPWNAALLDEMRVAPNGAHDDQLDALARAFAKLAINAADAALRYAQEQAMAALEADPNSPAAEILRNAREQGWI